MQKAEDAFQLSGLVSTAEVDFGQVPANKFARGIYGLHINEQSGVDNKLYLRQYSADGTTLEFEWSYNIGAYDTIIDARPLDTLVFTIPAGKYIKSVADAASIQLVLQVYDL